MFTCLDFSLNKNKGVMKIIDINFSSLKTLAKLINTYNVQRGKLKKKLKNKAKLQN